MTAAGPPASTGAGVTVRAHAKINLALRVGAPRADGYHPLTSVFEAIDLAEEVTATAREDGRITCAVDPASTHGADLDLGPGNLLVRAGVAVREAARHAAGTPVAAREAAARGVHLSVRKQVPVAGGLAGGSADAAAALVACDRLWGTCLPREVLDELARGLGADVPFALEGVVALGVDRGDRLTPVAVPPGVRHHWVLAVSDRGLSTPAVFAHLDGEFGWADPDTGPVEPGDAEDLLEALARPASPTGAVDLAPLLVNDLTEPALDLRPDLADTFAAFERAGALAVLLCGSGPTVAALCLDAVHAASVADVVRGAGVAADVLTVTGPAPGALAGG